MVEMTEKKMKMKKKYHEMTEVIRKIDTDILSAGTEKTVRDVKNGNQDNRQRGKDN